MKGLTLLVEDNDELAKFYQLNLKIWVGAQVHRAQNLKEVENLLQKYKNFSLIISKQSFSPMVKKLIESNQLMEIAHINIGSNKWDGVTIENGLNIKPLMQASAKALEVTAQDMAKLVVPDFFPIELSYFRFIKSLWCDVYVQLDRGHEKKFLKDEEIEPEALNELEKGGHEEVFVKKSDRLKMVTMITQEIVSNIKPEALNPQESLSANEMNRNLLQYKLSKVGITPETVDLVKSNMRGMISSTKRFPTISSMLAKLLNNKASYLYKHSQVLMFVCSHLMDNIDWAQDEQKKTINFVAFFHDIVLDTDEQAKIYSAEQLKNSKLSEKDKKLVEMHAQMAAELVQKFPHAPMGADVIVRQHHGIAHGVGFSTHYGANLSPMSVVFILAEDFVDYIISSGENFNLDQKIQQMRERFSTQRFKKIIDVLEEITL